MEELTFLVRGDMPEPFRVTVRRAGRTLTVRCGCPAASAGQYCGHRAQVLGGAAKNIIGAQAADLAKVKQWIRGTNVEEVFRRFRDTEQDFETVKIRYERAKRALAAALAG